MVARRQRPAWLVLAIVAILAGASARARSTDSDEPLTEDQVVARALERPAFVDAVRGTIEAQDGVLQASNLVPLPQITYLREQTFGTAGTGEDYLSVAQTIRLGYRHSARAAARKAKGAAARHDSEALRVHVAAEARERFYDVMHRQSRVAALEAWIVRIDEMLAIVTRREKRGDAALYDRKRLERERAVASARLDTELAALDRARARLGAVLGESARAPNITGVLLPTPDVASLDALRTTTATRPDLRALDLRATAARHELASYSRAWLPDLRIEAGWKGVGMPGQGRADGFMAAAMLSLAPRNLAAGMRRAARGEARAAIGRRALVQSEIRGELEGTRAEALRLYAAALEFRDQAVQTSADLVRIASIGYEGGELGLLEILDAHRGAADDALALLDLEHAARHARIELDRLTGAGAP